VSNRRDGGGGTSLYGRHFFGTVELFAHPPTQMDREEKEQNQQISNLINIKEKVLAGGENRRRKTKKRKKLERSRSGFGNCTKELAGNSERLTAGTEGGQLRSTTYFGRIECTIWARDVSMVAVVGRAANTPGSHLRGTAIEAQELTE
jgi:hypothetical protein